MKTLPPLHERSRQNYNRLSRWYDMLSGDKEFNLSENMLRKLRLAPGDVVLDIGFGTGRILLEAASQMEKIGYVIGVDISEGMCAIAHTRLNESGLGDRSLVVQGDACSLPMTGACLDAIIMTFSLELFSESDIRDILKECLRTLKRGGKLGIVCMSACERPNLPDRIYRLAHRIAPAIIDCRPIDLERIFTGLNQKVILLRQEKLWGLSVAQGILERK